MSKTESLRHKSSMSMFTLLSYFYYCLLHRGYVLMTYIRKTGDGFLMREIFRMEAKSLILYRPALCITFVSC